MTATLGPGPIAEPAITSKQFLDSFLEYGCWLRPLAAWSHLQAFERKNARELESLASLGSFYQLAGQVVEDALTMLVAWSIWGSDKQESLPDIVERLQLRLSASSKSPIGLGYVESIQQKISKTSKRVDVHPREYLGELLTRKDDALPGSFGIAWKRNPSVKLIPKNVLPIWQNLAHFIRDGITPLLDSRGSLLAACYNKIKHGPQVVVCSPLDIARSRGLEVRPDDLPLKNLSIRLLLKGSRVQETDEEQEAAERIAPFLFDDADNMRRWFFQQIIHTTNLLHAVGTFAFNTNYIDSKRHFSVSRAEVVEMIESQGNHLKRTFSI
ncbi:hypothetical protein BTK96_000826 [Burkholderia pyrrocinia]|nr:hypothetical protein [Burkholderia pyrrocinia]EKS9893597.1 hypothetical protein [Burkholderia pyrrocinia]EKS9905769.1 hypothetical protein [Burkholderia pyrrocinia]